MRIDKLLGNLGYGTRSEIKKLCKQGAVIVNGKEAKKADQHVNPEKDEILFNGELVNYREFVYLMLNKPAGYISATFDRNDATVLDLIDEKYHAFEPAPVGRLDKDTEGLLIITNDGKLTHRVLSPKKHVPKKYYAIVAGNVNSNDIKAFEKGVDIGEGYITKPASLEIIGQIDLDDISDEENQEKSEETNINLAGEDVYEIYLTISEGKFHQVKRMFQSVGKEVLYLKRVQMGGLELDESLELGEYRELTDDEIKMLEER